jgi:Raf kinase inhibitor-like YbhB/YbcL family protein
MLTVPNRYDFVITCLAVTSLFGCRAERGAPPATEQSNPDRGAAAPAVQPSRPGEGQDAMKINLTSRAFKNGETVPRKHTGEGEDVSPALAWDDAPKDTKEFALICDDPDAPTAEPWVHWVIYGIGAAVRELPEGVKSNSPELVGPVVARQGKNSWPSGVTVGYRGPMPPPGHGTHHYHFKLYALGMQLNLSPGATKQQLLDAIKGHVLAEAELIGTYERKK